MEDKQKRRQMCRYLLCLGLVCALGLGLTYARYSSAITGTGKATVAKVTLDSKADLSNVLQGMTPGAECTVSLMVSNAKDSNMSEITQEYSVIVKTTGNLPLEFTLENSGSAGEETYVNPESATDENNSRTWSGGRMPHSKKVTHNYTLKVRWPEEKKDATYADEIDKVTLTIDAKQAQ